MVKQMIQDDLQPQVEWLGDKARETLWTEEGQW